MSGLDGSETLAERLKRADASFNSRRHRALPSGLTPEEITTIADALVSTLRRTRQTALNLTPEDIALKYSEGRTSVEIPDGQPAQQKEIEQKAVVELLYKLLTGQNADQPLTYGRFAENYASTLNVIEKGQAAKYNSISELVGAFGWSLYQNQLATLAIPERAKNGKKRNQFFSFIPRRKAADPEAFFPAWLIAIFIGLAAFVLFSAWNTPAFDATATKPTRTPGLTPTTTLTPTLLVAETSLGSDGSQTTRYNPALSPVAETYQYKSPQELKAGQIASLSGGRVLNALNMQLSLGQNLLYLSLSDGGWEVWDMLSQKRISRRDLPNSESYSHISWSPNGENFVALGLDGQLRLGSQGQVKRITPLISRDNATNYNWQLPNSTELFRWSPNSNYLLVQLEIEFNNLQLWSFQDGVKQLTANPTRPNQQTFANVASQGSEWIWSADSRYLTSYNGQADQLDFFDMTSLLKIYSLDLSSLGINRSESVYSELAENLYSWSPDGRYIALVFEQPTMGSNPLNGSSKLLIAELPDQLPNDGKTIKPASSQVITLESAIGQPPVVNVNWSVDNRLLLLKTKIAEEVAFGSPENKETKDNKNISQLQVYALEGEKWQATVQHTLGETANLRLFTGKWLPDGQRVIINNSSGFLGVYTLPLKLEAAKDLDPPMVFNAEIAHEIALPTASPDNKWLAYLDKSNNITIRELATGKITYNQPFLHSLRIPLPSKLYWSADSKWLAGNSTIRQGTGTIAIWQVENGTLKFYGELFRPDTNLTEMQWETTTKLELFFEPVLGNVIAWDLTNPPPPWEEQQNKWATQVKTITSSPQSSFAQVDISQVKLPFRMVDNFSGVLGNSSTEDSWLPSWHKKLSRSDEVKTIYKLELSLQNSAVITPPKGYKIVELKPPLPIQNSFGNDFGFSPDSKFLAFGYANGLVQIYDANSGNQIRAFNAHTGSIGNISFSPDSKLLATVASDHSVKVWDIATGRSLYTLRGQSIGLGSPLWLSDNRTLLVNSQSGPLFWKLK